MKIKGYPPKITEDQAAQTFRGREKGSKIFFNMELLYAPFWSMTFHYSTIEDTGQKRLGMSLRVKAYLTGRRSRPVRVCKSVVVVADAVLGQVAFLKGEAEKMAIGEFNVKDDSVIKIIIPVDRVIGKAESELKKRLLSVYMWKTESFNLQLEDTHTFYVPLWVGYYRVGKEKLIQIEVMNALSGEVGDAWYRGIVEAGLLKMYQDREQDGEKVGKPLDSLDQSPSMKLVGATNFQLQTIK
ncbi:MAG: hypothetical protein ACUVTM_03815 [Candidatus Bathyarchaeia archaeon]